MSGATLKIVKKSENLSFIIHCIFFDVTLDILVGFRHSRCHFELEKCYLVHSELHETSIEIDGQPSKSMKKVQKKVEKSEKEKPFHRFRWTFRAF